ncbi:MAG: ATP-binding protein [Treponema sp.]|nr:ATP-binding protein [Treponema sp.]
MIKVIFKKLIALISHVQVLSVVLAFALMVFLSYHYMSGIERKHLFGNVNTAIENTQKNINTDLLEPQAALGIIAENIKNMILQNASSGAIHNYLVNTTGYITTNERLMSYVTSVYGYFDVFNGLFLTGVNWTPPDNFIPQTRPWFSTAVEAGGRIGVSQPYIDAVYGNTTLSFSQCIFDENGNRLGIVCLDISISRIQEYAVNTFVTEDSYGILFDKDFNVLAHPHPAYIGRNIELMNDGVAIKNDLVQGKEINELKVRDYNNNEAVGFIRQLDNGWYLAIIAYADKYYHSLREIGLILIALGTMLAVALISILLSVIIGRKKAEERTQIMLDATPLCANFWDKNYKVIDCNLEAYKLFELSSKKEYIDVFDKLSPEYQPDGRLSSEKSFEFLKKAFSDGYCRFEWMHRKLNGETIPCEITLVRAKYRNQYMVCGYSRDLRTLKALMAKMREADECTQVIFDATPLSCFMIDKNSKILESNQEIERLFGLTNKKEFIDQVFDFFPEFQPSGLKSTFAIKGYIDEAFEEGFCRFEWMHQKKDGEQIPTEVSLVRVKFRGEYAVAGYIRDLREIKAMIAEMRRAEVAEESNKAKSDFLAKMSHEIRTPMNAIMGITEIQLQDNTLPLVTKEGLERIYNSGDLLLGIINDILDLSKIEAGKLELVTTQYEIASLIHDTVKLNILRYESKPIDFKLIVNENIPAALIGDELRIKQILNNLLSNAFKYTQEGQIEFTLSVEPQEDAGLMLIFRVSDTGQGMTSDQVRKLGEKFSRFNMETNRKTEGTGLGMNITRNLIQLMNGSIEVESTPGLGSVFTVSLPQGYINSDPIGRQLAENLMKLNLKNTTKMRNAQITQEYMPYGNVLVIDDVESNLYVARGLLAPYGITVDTGLSGFEAIDRIRDGVVYDIIFMDHMMPRMDGIEAVRIIRSLNYSKPIVALTANALSGQAEIFLNNGFDDFISKPIDIRQLNTVLNKHIRDRQTPEVLDNARRQKNMLYAAGGHNIAIEPQLAEFFVRDAKKTVEILTAISENNCRRGDDLPAFLINVHAMKSALANVGESELAMEASRLEQAGREQNINLILSSLPEFLASLYSVIDKLSDNDDETSDEPADEASDEFLKEKLLAIRSACSSLNKKAAKEALAEIKQKNWPRHIRDQLSAIAKHLLHSEFEDVAEIAEKIKL